MNAHQEIREDLDEIKARAEAIELSMVDLLRRARVDYSTWTRWLNGTHEPRIRSLLRVKAALKRAEARAQ